MQNQLFSLLFCALGLASGCHSQEVIYKEKDLQWPKDKEVTVLLGSKGEPREQPYLPPLKTVLDRRHPFEADASLDGYKDGRPLFKPGRGKDIGIWYISTKKEAKPGEFDVIQIYTWPLDLLERAERGEEISSHEVGWSVYLDEGNHWERVDRAEVYEAWRQAQKASHPQQSWRWDPPKPWKRLQPNLRKPVNQRPKLPWRSCGFPSFH